MKKMWIFIRNILPGIICFFLYSSAALADEKEWHTKSLSFETLGSDVNGYFRIVGLPKHCIGQLMAGRPEYSEDGHDFFAVAGHPKLFLEVDYSNDGQSIDRFRFIQKTSDNVKKNEFGGWQTKNLRKRANDFTTDRSIVILNDAKDSFAMPFASVEFTSKSWKSDLEQRCWMLFDIAHASYIGMTHSEVIGILGAADYSPNVPSIKSSGSDYVDQYLVSQASAGPNSVLEMAYKEDKVVGFRVAKYKRNPSL